MPQTVAVLIDENGDIEVQTSGFAGPDCKKATADLERALGKTSKDVITPEYHKRPVVTQKARG